MIGCVDEALDLGEGDDLVQLGVDPLLGHAQDAAAEIDVFPAGQLLMKSGTDFEQGRHACPEPGSSRWWARVMRDRIFSRVLLPAPLRPMMPRTSPALRSNVMSRSAQIAFSLLCLLPGHSRLKQLYQGLPQHVAALGLPQPELLPEPLNGNRGIHRSVASRQTMSVK